MPLMLSLVMIPLEYMLHTVRPVSGSVLQLLSHVSALFLRLAGSLSLDVGKLLIHGYDLLIFVPLRVESHWQARLKTEQTGQVPVAEVDAVNVTALKFGAANTERRH